MVLVLFDLLYNGVNFFDIYIDGFIGQISLFGFLEGGCNFVDLILGVNGVKCGCCCFWSCQVMVSVGGQDQIGWCMCNYYVCFYDFGDCQFQEVVVNVVGQENECLRIGCVLLSLVMDF